MTSVGTVALVVALCYLAAGLCVLPILIGASVAGIRLRLAAVATTTGWGAVVVFLGCFAAVRL